MPCRLLTPSDRLANVINGRLGPTEHLTDPPIIVRRIFGSCFYRSSRNVLTARLKMLGPCSCRRHHFANARIMPSGVRSFCSCRDHHLAMFFVKT